MKIFRYGKQKPEVQCTETNTIIALQRLVAAQPPLVESGCRARTIAAALYRSRCNFLLLLAISLFSVSLQLPFFVFVFFFHFVRASESNFHHPSIRPSIGPHVRLCPSTHRHLNAHIVHIFLFRSVVLFCWKRLLLLPICMHVFLIVSSSMIYNWLALFKWLLNTGGT